ncbi:MAG: isoprenyl transferase [Flavobacteriales bacterium]|jgi:undecaprenyl diphosphate synthase|nr:isoprenyl transferase [Flavobacteriales bacterium]|tara:strand:- start:42325 stop:43065 length:741 start_codon:yes stop_codon:yes gene_type:complete
MNVEINKNNIPKHIAIIMDGNGRWAKEKGKKRFFGHIEGVKAVKKIVESCIKINIKYLTLFTFSKENWKRPRREVNMLMNLFIATIKENKHHLLSKKVKINIIGSIEDLPKNCQIALKEMVLATKNNSGLTLTLALSYSSRFEILEAVKKILELKINKKQIDLTEKLFESYLQTYNLPEPELLIRTSGEKRISNFLLWQIAFSELYFSKKKWPDFDEEELYMAIFEYQKRERRFGKTTEQINNEII